MVQKFTLVSWLSLWESWLAQARLRGRTHGLATRKKRREQAPALRIPIHSSLLLIPSNSPLRQPTAATSPKGGGKRMVQKFTLVSWLSLWGIVGNGFIRSESGRHKCLPYKHGEARLRGTQPFLLQFIPCTVIL